MSRISVEEEKRGVNKREDKRSEQIASKGGGLQVAEKGTFPRYEE
jgi:hypothetical protein